MTSSTMTTTVYHQFVPLARMVLSFFVAALCGGGLAAMAVSYSTSIHQNLTPAIHTSSEYHHPVDQQQQLHPEEPEEPEEEEEEELLRRYQARIESLETKLTQLTTAFTMMERMTMNKNKNDDNTGAASTSAAGTAAVATPDTTGRRMLDEYEEWKQRPPLTAVETERVLLDSEATATSNNFPPIPDNDLVCTQFQSWVLEQTFTSYQNSSQVPTNRSVRIYIYIHTYIYICTHI